MTDLNHHLTLTGELDGVAKKIDQTLTYALWIANDPPGNFRMHIDDQFQILAGSLQAEHGAHIFDVAAQIHFQHFNIKFAGFNLGEVQNVIDDAQ